MKGTKNGVSLELRGSVWGIGEEKWRKKKEKEKIKIKIGAGICGEKNGENGGKKIKRSESGVLAENESGVAERA